MPATKKKAVKSSQEKTYTAQQIRTMIIKYLKETDRCYEAIQIANEFLAKKLNIVTDPKEGECWLIVDPDMGLEHEVRIIKNYHAELVAIDENEKIWPFGTIEFIEKLEENS